MRRSFVPGRTGLCLVWLFPASASAATYLDLQLTGAQLNGAASFPGGVGHAVSGDGLTLSCSTNFAKLLTLDLLGAGDRGDLLVMLTNDDMPIGATPIGTPISASPTARIMWAFCARTIRAAPISPMRAAAGAPTAPSPKRRAAWARSRSSP